MEQPWINGPKIRWEKNSSHVDTPSALLSDSTSLILPPLCFTPFRVQSHPVLWLWCVKCSSAIFPSCASVCQWVFQQPHPSQRVPTLVLNFAGSCRTRKILKLSRWMTSHLLLTCRGLFLCERVWPWWWRPLHLHVMLALAIVFCILLLTVKKVTSICSKCSRDEASPLQAVHSKLTYVSVLL